MKDKIIAAALTEMEIHSLRFTMEDLTRRLGRVGKIFIGARFTR